MTSPKPLFQGITYTRDARSEPRPLVIHVLAVDSRAGHSVFVRPGKPVKGRHLAARRRRVSERIRFCRLRSTAVSSNPGGPRHPGIITSCR
jgi:hypothetical protein